MKLKSYITLAGVALGMTLTSCNDFLDREPISDLSTGIYWKTEADIKTWNSGMYYGLQSTLQSNLYAWGDLRSGVFNPSGTSYDKAILYNGLTSSHGTTSWTNLYATIYRANAGLKHIPETGLGPTVINPYLGQAYAMRALMYFYAIRVWGDVPLILEPYEDNSTQEKYYPRTEVATVLEQILQDLDDAATCFGPELNMSNANKYYLNRGAVQAIKVDVLMWAHRYEDAKLEAKKLIDNYGYKMELDTETYYDMFRRSPLAPVSAKDTEIIFSMYWDFNEYGNGLAFAQYFASGSNTIPYKLSKATYNKVLPLTKTNADVRASLILDTLKMSASCKSQLKVTEYTLDEDSYGVTNVIPSCPKFSTHDASANDGAGGFSYLVNKECDYHVPIYRLAYIKMLYAEALIMTNDNVQEAIDIVNELRTRAGNADLASLADYPTQTDRIKLLLDEGIMEFWCEGKHWFNLVRTHMVKEYLDPIYATRGDESLQDGFDYGVADPGPDHIGGFGRLLWPLNQDVFRKNPYMKGQQNLPYDE